MFRFIKTVHRNKLYRNAALLYGVTFLVILPPICNNLPERHLPYNIIFDFLSGMGEKEYQTLHMKQNHERFKQSLEILQNFNSDPVMIKRVNYVQDKRKPDIADTGNLNDNTRPPVNSLPFSLAISVVTVGRTGLTEGNYNPHYLLQTVAGFLRVINESKAHVHLSVCNVDRNPEKHTDMKYIPKDITVFQRFQKTSADNNPILTKEALYEKERHDYIFCAEKVLERNTSFVLLVEDDTVPKDNLFSVLKTKLSNPSSTIPEEREKFEDILFIKLQYPETNSAYLAREWYLFERIPELILSAVFLAALFTYAYTKYHDNTLPRPQIRRIFRILLVYFICVLLSIGRQNIIQLGRLSECLYLVTPAKFCHATAHLYPRSGLQFVKDYLKTVTCNNRFHKDHAMDAAFLNTKYLAKMIQPNLFKHIGHFSTLGHWHDINNIV